MADTSLYLGDFKFEEFEIPERIPLGGKQSVVVHRFPGGAKLVQAMGRDDDPIYWSGMFTGSTALERARHLDLLRIQGKTQTLFFFDFIYRVLITSYSFVPERINRVPYTIEMEVIEDLTQPQTTFPATGYGAAIGADGTDAMGLGQEIGDGELNGLLSTMDNAIKSVSDFAKATQATINSVMGPVAAVMTRVNILIGGVSNTVNTVTTLGGVLPNNPISRQAAGMMTQVTAMTQLPALYRLQSVTSRIQTNLNLINAGPNARVVTVGGGTLFDVAAREYGDATKWSAIAEANNLTETNIDTVQRLVIPNDPPDNGGVFKT
jgi:hypothetical protein